MGDGGGMKCYEGPEVVSGPDVVQRAAGWVWIVSQHSSGVESRENNHCIRSLACCISIVPHLIAYFDLRQLL